MSSYRDFEVAKFMVVKVPCISHIKTSQHAPTFLDFWTWDFGSHVYNILGCPELFQDLFGYWTWDFGSHVYNILGCPELFQDLFGSLDLGL